MADVLVHPSYREGFPNVVIEAGAMGLPAIVTDINGSREIIEHGRNGLIVPPRRSAPLAAAMKRLFDDDALRRNLAAPARPMIPPASSKATSAPASKPSTAPSSKRISPISLISPIGPISPIGLIFYFLFLIFNF